MKLDFGDNFPGPNRFLEIHVRQTGSGTFTPLVPRQPITRAPHAIKALSADGATNATQLGGVDANQYVVTTDPRMSDARTPIGGSADYIQNRTTQQALSNFNVSGDGTVGGSLSGNIVTTGTQFNINTSRFLSSPGTFNTFAGISAGNANNIGANNSFFGYQSGLANTGGNSNSFFGAFEGNLNDAGSNNSFFGLGAGSANQTGNNNSFFGNYAGSTNQSGSNNTVIGIGANVGATNLSFATAIGASAIVSSSNTLVLGRNTDTVQIPGNLGSVNVTGNGAFTGTVGIGTTPPTGFYKLQVQRKCRCDRHSRIWRSFRVKHTNNWNNFGQRSNYRRIRHGKQWAYSGNRI